jgi:hypothetical protein
LARLLFIALRAAMRKYGLALDPDQSPPAAMVTTLALMSRNDFFVGISIAWLCIVVAGMLALLVL